MRAALSRIDALLDAAVRSSARAQDVGVLRAFLSNHPWPYYARPRPELDLSGHDAVTVEDVRAAAEVLAASGASPAFEWIPERVPSMAAAVKRAGWSWRTCPILARRAGSVDVRAPRGVRLHRLTADGELASAAVVSELAFREADHTPGGRVAGPVARDKLLAARPADAEAHVRRRIAAGLNVAVVAVSTGDGGVIGTATLQPIGDCAEIVGVATLPSHRRRGIAAAMTDFLVAEAVRCGVDLVCLSALTEQAEALYLSRGFERVGYLTTTAET